MFLNSAIIFLKIHFKIILETLFWDVRCTYKHFFFVRIQRTYCSYEINIIFHKESIQIQFIYWTSTKQLITRRIHTWVRINIIRRPWNGILLSDRKWSDWFVFRRKRVHWSAYLTRPFLKMIVWNRTNEINDT